MSATEVAKELANIHHFHSDHYAICLPPKFRKIVFSNLSWVLQSPHAKKNRRHWLYKILGGEHGAL